jgi:glycosyltransferase involved in cell wall biosynthesis
MASATPLVSVIVPVWNRPEDIRQCLASLTQQTLSKSDYEIIVVDNGSSDETPDVARAFEGVTVLTESRPGSYAARNLGLSVARGRHVAFIDSDCTADPHWLEAALRAAQVQPEAGVIAGHIDLKSEGGPTSPVCDAYERIFAFNQARNVSSGIAVTANWLSPADVVRAVGGFRAELKSGGDVDLAKRIRAAGYVLVYAPDMIVTHPARVTFPELAAKTRRVMGGRMASRPVKGGKLGWAWLVARDTAYRMRTVWRSQGLASGMKLQLSAMLLVLLGISHAEIVRIALGGEARRA